MAINYAFEAVAEEGLMLRCPLCGRVFFQGYEPAPVIDCPDCGGEEYDPMDFDDSATDPAEVVEEVENDFDPEPAYADDDLVSSGRYDDDPDPYAGTYSEE